MSADSLAPLFAALPSLHEFHAPGGDVYELLKLVARREVEARFAEVDAKSSPFGPFGELRFPYERMGAIDSLDLFGIDELIIFSFYWLNRHRYKRVLDLGANIGVHSIMLARCGFEVACYEPDPVHLRLLERNLAANHVKVEARNAAVSISSGKLEFIRVLGNTTGSHLAGSKPNVYGDTDRFQVDVVPFADIIPSIDLIKMDVEGHEKVILTSTTAAQWQHLDMIAEIGSVENATSVFAHFLAIGVNLFAQKIGWHRVERLEDMPSSYKHGSLFISAKDRMPWVGH